MPSNDQQQNVRTSSPSLLRPIFYALFGLPFVGGGLMTSVIPLKAVLSSSSGPGSMIFPLLFMGVAFLGAGGWVWWKAYQSLRRWRAFDTSYLQLETEPVPLGSSLRARLRAPISADDQPPNGFQIRAAAIQQSGDDKKVGWENWTSVRGQPGASETEIPLSLDLPVRPLPDHRLQMAEDTPWSSAKDAIEGLDWTLEVTASFDDKPDYEASFDLPVSVPDDLDQRTSDDPSSDGSISSPESAGPDDEAASAALDEEEAYWGVGDGDESNLRHADSDPETSVDAEETFSEPVTDRIEMEE